MNAKTGFEAWREQNLRLPFPDEFRIMSDGSMKAIWNNIERGWYSLFASFTWESHRGHDGGGGDRAAGLLQSESHSPQ